MHKKEAAYLFGILANEDNVKISKFLYNQGELSFLDLKMIIGSDDITLNNNLNTLIEANLVIKDGDTYKANIVLYDELLEFIKTPCGCMR